MTLQAGLIADAKAGCNRSRGELLEKFRKYLRTLARVQVHQTLNGKADASDVVQESFLRAHEHFSAFRGTTEAELCAWLRAILASKLADLYRFHMAQMRSIDVEQKYNKALDQSSVTLTSVFVDLYPSPSEIASRNEHWRIVADAIEDLPPDYRTVVLLRHVRGLPYAEVAAEMDRSVDSVKKLWIRALAQLQRTVEANR